MLNHDVRAVDELAHHGIRPDASGPERPVYGYVGVSGSEHPKSVQHYGEVTLVLKDKVRERTTVTLGDSLNTHSNPVPIDAKLTPREVSDATARTIYRNEFTTVAKGGYTPIDRGMTYIEAQIVGGVKRSDIEEIVFGPNAEIDAQEIKSLTEKMRPFGISVNVQVGF
jgi:hypothetical protein